MMKIGILTFHYTNNPGSVLQAYALQYIVRSMGVECNVVNYQVRNWLRTQYEPLIRKKVGFLWPLAMPVVLMMIRFSFIPYNRFRKNYATIAPKKKVTDFYQMRGLDKYYDKWIVGSDQVWNLDNAKVDDVLFLDFTNESRKKIAYAASFGRNDIPSGYEEVISRMLRDFSYISVREMQGAGIVKKLTGKDAEVVLDPTLLLSREQWSKIACPPREQGYILVYLRQRSMPIARMAETLSKETGLPVITIREVWPTTAVGKQVICPSPEKWLGYVLNAKYVITNSFHGMAFSINFHKQFFAVQLENEIKVTNSRIYSILEQFNLQNRLVKEETELLKMTDIDFDCVNEILNSRREDSLQFLHSVC